MARLSIVRKGALGDILCLLNISPQIKKEFGGFDFYCHESCHSTLKNFVMANDLCEGFFSLKNVTPPIDAVSPTLYPFHEGYPNKNSSKHLVYHAQDELKLKTSLLEPIGLLSPQRPVAMSGDRKNITIQYKTGWSKYKEYPRNEELVHTLNLLDFRIIQIGGPNDPVIPGISYSLIGRPFEEQVAAQCWADAHVGPDSVFNHTTNYVWSHKERRTPGVICFGSTSRILSGYDFNENLSLDLECQPCFRENPGISNQKTDECPFGHKCLNGLTPEEIVDRILKIA